MFLKRYQEFLVSVFGYSGAMRFEDSTVFLSGIFIGVLIMALLAGSFIYKISKIDDFKNSKMSFVRNNKDGKASYRIDFRSLGEAVEQVLMLSLSPFFTRKDYTLRDQKRTKWCLNIVYFVGVIVLIFAILSIFTVYTPQ